MNTRFLWLIFPALLVLLTACAKGQPAQSHPDDSSALASSYQTITADEANTMMEESDAFILLDVRTQEEFSEKRIDGAILLPDYEVAETAADVLPDQDALILVYCRSGRRSALAAEALANLGYTNVYDFGGIIDWPYETVSG